MRGNGGWEMFRIIEIEKYPCNDKREAEKRETEVMKELKANLNMRNSYVSDEDKRNYIESHKEEQKLLTFTALTRRRPSFLGDSAPGRRRSVRCSSQYLEEQGSVAPHLFSVIMLSPSTRPPESAPASLVLYYKTPSPVPIPGFFARRTFSRRRRRAHRPCESAQTPRINPSERPRTATLISAHLVLLVVQPEEKSSHRHIDLGASCFTRS